MKIRFLHAVITAAVCLISTHSNADFYTGLAAYKAGNFGAAVEEFQYLSDEGDPYAQFMLGKMYANGQGLVQDYQTAIELIRNSAEQGLPDAQLRLGIMYAEGLGVDKNYQNAEKWYQLASQQPNIDDDFRAIVEQRLVASWIALADIYSKGTDVQQDFGQAAIWYRLAAENAKNAKAQFSLGLLYLQGKGVVQDFKLALKFFREAAEQGDMNAQNNLASMYATGDGGIQNYQEAAYWYRKAAEQGHIKAQLTLGASYENGLGVQQDKEEALRWYIKAAQQGDVVAKQRVDSISNVSATLKTDIPSKTVADINIDKFSDSNWLGLDTSLLLTAKKNFGVWGVSLLAVMFVWLFVKYYNFRRLKAFVARAKSSLSKLERRTPEALDSALLRAKIGLFLGLITLLIFSTMWYIGGHMVGLLLAIILSVASEKLFRKNNLILKFSLFVERQETFCTSEAGLLAHNIEQDKNTLKNNFKNLLESKKVIDRRKRIYLQAEEIFTAVLACLEAEGKVKILNLGFENYFSSITYVDNFCESIIENLPSISQNEKTQGLQIKKLVEIVVKNSALSKAAAYDFIIGYFSGGKALVKKGSFVFYTNDQADQLPLCVCCGQIISIPVVLKLTGEEFCSDTCLKIYTNLFSDKFKPSEKFSSASTLIGYGVDGLLITDIASQYVANQKIYAVGGQGHGFAAEQANTYIDKISGKDAEVVGDDNAKNGADRLVDGQYMQTKYCQTAARSVGAMLEGQSGPWKYFLEDGNVMPVEVPKDQYVKAIETVKKAAAEGRIPGVTAEDAHKIVIKGSATYTQAVNITKFGTVESLAFDLRQGIVGSMQGASISLLLGFSQSYWRTKNSSQAFEFAVVSASKVLVKQTSTAVLVSQLQRLSIVQNAFSIPIPSSMNSMLAKGLNVGRAQVPNAVRGMLVANAVVISLSATKDMYHVIGDQMSGGQFFKNTTVTTSAVVTGSVGAVAGKIIGGTLGSIGGPVGAFLGAALFSHLASVATKSLLDNYIEDDKIVTVRLVKYQVKYLSDAYMMTPEETQIVIDNVIQDAFRFAPSDSGFIKINEIILSHVIYLVKRRPKVEISEFQQRAMSQIGFAG